MSKCIRRKATVFNYADTLIWELHYNQLRIAYWSNLKERHDGVCARECLQHFVFIKAVIGINGCIHRWRCLGCPYLTYIETMKDFSRVSCVSALYIYRIWKHCSFQLVSSTKFITSLALRFWPSLLNLSMLSNSAYSVLCCLYVKKIMSIITSDWVRQAIWSSNAWGMKPYSA